MIEILEKNYKLACMIDLSLEINGIKLPMSKGIIDTGCQFTRISINDICKGLIDPFLLKAEDIRLYRQGKINVLKSIGVNDKFINEDLSLLSDSQLMSREDIGFLHTVDNLQINGQNIGSHVVKYAYRYNSPTLIGMNILKKFEWSYKDGVFKLSTKTSKGSSISECIKKLSKLIFNDRLLISEAITSLSDEFTEDCINTSLPIVLGDTYYEGD